MKPTKHILNRNLSDYSYVVVTHYLIYSASQALRDYLRSLPGSDLLYISHPLGTADTKTRDVHYCEVSSGATVQNRRHTRIRFANILLKTLHETFLTFWWTWRSGKMYDVYVGVDNLNAAAGILLKKMGRVRKVVYYTIDYFPTRFENKLINLLYHGLDKWCVAQADETWNVSDSMIPARRKHNGMNPAKYNRQHTVPIGIWYDKAPRFPFDRINHTKLIFAGHLVPHMGVDLIIRALPLIRKKIPSVTLDIIGGGQELEHLEELAKKNNVAGQVTFHGWIRDRKKFERLLATGAVGMATFNTDILDDKVKNADPGKLKDYMLVGMPVVITDAIYTKDAIIKEKCGITIGYNEKECAEAVVQLLKDTKTLKTYRDHALDYVRQFDYGVLFKKNLTRIVS